MPPTSIATNRTISEGSTVESAANLPANGRRKSFKHFVKRLIQHLLDLVAPISNRSRRYTAPDESLTFYLGDVDYYVAGRQVSGRCCCIGTGAFLPTPTSSPARKITCVDLDASVLGNIIDSHQVGLPGLIDSLQAAVAEPAINRINNVAIDQRVLCLSSSRPGVGQEAREVHTSVEIDGNLLRAYTWCRSNE